MTHSEIPNRYLGQHSRMILTATVLFGCALVIILAEVSARIFLPGWHPPREERVKFWRYDELLGWSHNPGQRGVFRHGDFSVEVAINSRGLRDSEYALERNDKRRMLVLGDSFAWGFGVEHHERFSEILENVHPDWEIINAAVSGYGTDQQFLYLKHRGMAYKPDVVLLLMYRDDLTTILGRQSYWYNKPLFILSNGELKLQNTPVPKSTLKQRLRRFLLGRTYLGRLGRRTYLLCVRIRSALPFLSSTTETREDPKGRSRRRIGRELSHRLIKATSGLCDECGVKFALVSFFVRPGDTEFVQEVCKIENIPYLSLDESFSSAQRKYTFPHDGHWNAYGHEVAAIAIDEFLREQGVF